VLVAWRTRQLQEEEEETRGLTPPSSTRSLQTTPHPRLLGRRARAARWDPAVAAPQLEERGAARHRGEALGPGGEEGQQQGQPEEELGDPGKGTRGACLGLLDPRWGEEHQRLLELERSRSSSDATKRAVQRNVSVCACLALFLQDLHLPVILSLLRSFCRYRSQRSGL
jgi:hypothetical protein